MVDRRRPGPVGASVIGADQMGHNPEGVRNPASIGTVHGMRILSGPLPLWLDAEGRRLPVPLVPGFDALGALGRIAMAGHSHSGFCSTSGSARNW